MTKLYTAFVAAAVAAQALLWTRLPEPMATHWGANGHPNGTMPRVLNLVVIVGFLTLGWAIARVTPERFRTALMASFGGFIMVVYAWVLVANLNADSWQEAELPAPWLLIGLIVGGVIVMATMWWRATPRPEPITEPPVFVDLAETETGIWIGSARSTALVLLAFGLALVALLMPSWIPFVVLSVALAMAALSSVEVTVNEEGAHVRLGPFGWPRWTIELHELRRADPDDIDPMAYGGWGYRISPGSRAIIIRRGDAIRLSRVDASDFVITLDNPEPGAALLNEYLRRSGRLEGQT